jgi:hypothetical protein
MNENKNYDAIDELLLKALKTEPDTDLPLGFAAIVTRKAFASKKTPFRNSLQAILCGLLIGLLACLALYLLDTNIGSRVFGLLYAGKFIIATAAVAFLIIQYLESKLVQTFAKER